MEYAYKVAKEVGADLKIISDINNEDYENKRFDKNIILPIKPIYAEEILSNRKKYEFRKKLCVANINKIYLYATAPYMCIIGEVEVRAKLVMEKNRLWNIVKDSAGISFKYYEEYFKKYKKHKVLNKYTFTFKSKNKNSHYYIKKDFDMLLKEDEIDDLKIKIDTQNKAVKIYLKDELLHSQRLYEIEYNTKKNMIKQILSFFK